LDLDENGSINLPNLCTTPEIPVNGEDIPTREDVHCWPQLNGIFIPHVEIILPISSDVPEALDQVKVKHSQNGSPNASRMHFG